MKKRNLTPEQAAARDARREKFRAITKRVAEMTDAERAELSARCGFIPTCEGRTLSPKNSIYVMMQLPAASMVGGFRQWLRVGRAVRKGEHGAAILVPLGAKRTNPETGETDILSDGHHFTTTTVFDISQTQELEPEGVNRAA